MINVCNLRYTVVMLIILNLLSACAVFSGQESTGEYIDDATITAKVKAAIIDDPSLNNLNIKVETFQNVVQLSGFVSSQQAKNQAEKLARGVEGVEAVKNSIIVRKKGSKH